MIGSILILVSLLVMSLCVGTLASDTLEGNMGFWQGFLAFWVFVGILGSIGGVITGLGLFFAIEDDD